MNRDRDLKNFDDLPANYRANIEMDAPFGRRPGSAPVLNDQEIDAIVAFLRTLTDGYNPGK